MVTARDLMRPCPTVAETTTVAEIVARMAVDPEGFYGVLDARGELSGIVTEGDMVRLLYESGHYETPPGFGGRLPEFLGYSLEQLRAVDAASVMTSRPETISPDTPLDDVAQTLFRHRRKQLPVTEGKRLVGAVRRIDVVKRVLR